MVINDYLKLINDDLLFTYKDKEYLLTSSPYEPCLYINEDNVIKHIIHNSFSISEIIECDSIDSISGKKYDKDSICELICYVIDNNIYETDISYVEKNNIDPFYKELKKYDELEIDYFIVNNENNHKDAVINAMNQIKEKYKKEYDYDIIYDSDKIEVSNILDSSFFDSDNKYCHMFLNPPNGCSYNIDDFNKLNKILFPNGIENLEIYDFKTNFSNYFDEGNEWWGSICVSLFDKTLGRFVIILASASD